MGLEKDRLIKDAENQLKIAKAKGYKCSQCQRAINRDEYPRYKMTDLCARCERALRED